MHYTTLGRSGLTVSRICLGCMSFGTPAWRPWVLDEAAARPFFRRAVELGITFFDTADMYSLGVSEEVTGRAIRELLPRDEAVIATKVYFPMNDRPNMRGLGRKHVVQACEASLRRLGVEAIDLYQIHRFDATVPLEETLRALDDLVRAGKVRYVGASSGHAWRFMKALATSDAHGWSRFVSMQNHHNLLYREEEREMLPLCEAEGIGTLAWSPLARGLLARAAGLETLGGTARGASDGYTRTLYGGPGDAAVLAALREVAGARGNTPAEVAMAWLLGRPTVAAAIIGATKPEHLEQAVRALEVQLAPAERATLEAPYVAQGVRGFEGPAR